VFHRVLQMMLGDAPNGGIARVRVAPKMLRKMQQNQ
jgi:hypothetical protein